MPTHYLYTYDVNTHVNWNQTGMPNANAIYNSLTELNKAHPNWKKTSGRWVRMNVQTHKWERWVQHSEDKNYWYWISTNDMTMIM